MMMVRFIMTPGSPHFDAAIYDVSVIYAAAANSVLCYTFL